MMVGPGDATVGHTILKTASMKATSRWERVNGNAVDVQAKRFGALPIPAGKGAGQARAGVEAEGHLNYAGFCFTSGDCPWDWRGAAMLG
jgi:hypothetical protein